MSKKYQDAQMSYLKEDILKIQVKTNMYINEYGEAGAFHLAREVIQNAFDECLDDASPGNKIDIIYDRSTDLLTTSDNGRAFNEEEYPMSIFVTTLQSGSKFFRNSGAASAGEFGVGLTVVNALSDVFDIISYREFEKTKHELQFHEGKCLKDKITSNKKGVHGTTVNFRVSKKYMGENAKLPIDDVIKWIDSLFYLDSDRLKKKGIRCHLTIMDGFDTVKTYKFKPKPFSDLINEILPNTKKSSMSELCAFNGSTLFTEDTKTLVENKDGTTSVKNVKEDKEIHLDIALRYCDTEMNDGPQYNTFCNYTNTIDNGVHLDAFDEAYCRFMQNATNESMSDNQKAKLKITWDDVRTNLFCVINLSTNAQVGFVGNAKHKIGNRELIPYIKDIVTNGLDKFFKDHKDVLEEYIKIIKLNAKSRIEAAKIKTATQTERLNTFKEHKMSNYIRCNNSGKQFKVIYLTEGNSAGSSCRNGSDPDCEAFFLLRGVPANAMKCSLSQIMENKEFRDLTTILRCGIGQKCDVNKLYFNRINIFTDADVDGYNISASLLAFFYKFMRPVIEAGKLYKVYSPLYRLKDKNYPYVANKSELIELYHKKIINAYKIRVKGEKFMTKNELKEFLLDTYNYSEDLKRASAESGNINKFLVEMIIASLVLTGIVRSSDDYDDFDKVFSSQKFIKTIMSKIQSKFKEIVVDETGTFSGVVDGKYSLIKVNKRFLKKTASLIEIYKKYGYEIEVKNKGHDDIRTMSIAEFLDDAQKVLPLIDERFKGLGELNANELYETTLDLNNAISVQYTIDDVEKVLKTFELTHGASKKDAEGRKKLMKEYHINRDDLDN
jgi:DNA gyrase subunit B